MKRLSTEGIEPEESAPAPDRLLSGSPVFRVWDVDQTESGVYAGIWESTPGKWAVAYSEWEYCRVLSGVSIVTDEDGGSVRLEAGDSLVLKPGFKGSWEVVETTLKEYVIQI